MKRAKCTKDNQKGFTLVELLVAIPLVAVVVLATGGGLIQMLKSRDASTHMYALRQVQTAGYWVSTDALQADTVDADPIQANTILILNWTDWEPDVPEVHSVQYYLTGSAPSMELMRHEVVRDLEGDLLRESTMVAARHLTMVTCVRDGDKLQFTVTARVSDREATRTYDIRPRALTS